jgi:hypothetical protein
MVVIKSDPQVTGAMRLASWAGLNRSLSAAVPRWAVLEDLGCRFRSRVQRPHHARAAKSCLDAGYSKSYAPKSNC